MKNRLYLDEDAMDNDLVDALRDRGLNMLTAREAGFVNQPDDKHLSFATKQGRALYSFNARDYYPLHKYCLS